MEKRKSFTRYMKTIFFIVISVGLFQQSAAAYEFKALSVPGYSKTWLMIKSESVPITSITKIRLHLHGWTQDPVNGKPFNDLFDFSWRDSSVMPSDLDMKTLIEGYGMQREVDAFIDTAILVPISRGHCDQYPELLKDFDITFSKVISAFGFNSDFVRLDHVSAHSGGGEYLSRLITSNSRSSFFQQLKKVTFYDAIYSESAKKRLSQWLNEVVPSPSRNLEVINVPNGSPSVFGASLFDSVKASETKKTVAIDSTTVRCREKIHQAGNSLQIIEENHKPTLLDHWTLVKALWLFTCNPDPKRTPSSKKNSR